ncbi:MAG: HAD family hydrolase [Lachnospiraceae bacterium]|nr:HAD family hydrolase [Lachnospiraceae bacterium]
MKQGKRHFNNIIFDVDGVLIDSMPIWENSANLYLEKVWGIVAYPELDRDCATMSLLEAGAYIKKCYPQITASEQELADGVVGFIRERYLKAPAKLEMIETVKTLFNQGYHLYLATASETENVRGVLNNLGVWDCFEEIFTCTDIGYSKSYREYFETVADMIGVPCRELLMIEDSLHSMVTAKEAGLTVIGVYDESSEENTEKIKEVCDGYLASLGELMEWI